MVHIFFPVWQGLQLSYKNVYSDQLWVKSQNLFTICLKWIVITNGVLKLSRMLELQQTRWTCRIWGKLAVVLWRRRSCRAVRRVALLQSTLQCQAIETKSSGRVILWAGEFIIPKRDSAKPWDWDVNPSAEMSVGWSGSSESEALNTCGSELSNSSTVPNLLPIALDPYWQRWAQLRAKGNFKKSTLTATFFSENIWIIRVV